MFILKEESKLLKKYMLKNYNINLPIDPELEVIT